MNLENLGFSVFFREQISTDATKNFEPARVMAVNRDNYIVQNEKGECSAELTGKFIYAVENSLDRPTTGDWVLIQSFDNHSFATIHRILKRKTLLKRKSAGVSTDIQLIGANIDTAFVMQATDYNINRLERYLVMIREGGIHPIILLSKSDLFNKNDLDKRKNKILKLQGVSEVISFSNLDQRGVAEISERLLPQKTFCLLGSSGVGKTTLLNSLLDSQEFSIGEVREKDGRGRHTTTRRQLTVLANGSMIIDTPGMRELGNFDIDEGLSEVFQDIKELAGECRFSDCSHQHEKGCAVLAALENGDIESTHYKNFLKLKRESDHLERSYIEKRRRDKEFGKMVKRIINEKHKR